MNGTLIRHGGVGCTLGVLVLDNGFTLQTLERPWLDNAPNISCIPTGFYDVIPWKSPSKGDCFKVLDVPAREDILIHVGNTVEDTLGCILVGLARWSPTLISSSVPALRDLRQQAPEGFRLQIINGQGV